MAQATSVTQLFEDFLNNLTGRSRHNQQNYRRRLRHFLAEYGDMPVEQVSAKHVNAWIDAIESRGLAEATLAGYRQALKAFWSYAVECRLAAKSPAAHVTIGSFASGRVKLPNEADVMKMADVALAWLRAGTAVQVRDALIFLLSLTSGPRLREIRELRKTA